MLTEAQARVKVGDVVIIEYWYNNMITNVTIKDIIGRKFLISHDTPGSKIHNAPDELILKSDIIDFYKNK